VGPRPFNKKDHIKFLPWIGEKRENKIREDDSLREGARIIFDLSIYLVAPLGKSSTLQIIGGKALGLPGMRFVGLPDPRPARITGQAYTTRAFQEMDIFFFLFFYGSRTMAKNKKKKISIP